MSRLRTIKPIIALRHSLPSYTKMDKLITGSIQKWTDSKYFHAELVLDNTWVSATFTNNVKLYPLRPLNTDDWDYIELPKTVLTKEQYEKFYEYLDSQLNAEYDWKGIWLSQAVRLNSHSEGKWFCSELVAKLLQMLYIEKTLNLEPNNIAPGDLAKLFELE